MVSNFIQEKTCFIVSERKDEEMPVRGALQHDMTDKTAQEEKEAIMICKPDEKQGLEKNNVKANEEMLVGEPADQAANNENTENEKLEKPIIEPADQAANDENTEKEKEEKSVSEPVEMNLDTCE